MSEQIRATVVESRVDWITATALLSKMKTPDEYERCAELSESLLCAEETLGNDLKHTSALGFKGLQSGGVMVGVSKQGYMFRLSGDSAALNWKRVHDVATNVSRIDCAATIRLEAAWRDMSLVHLAPAREYAKQTSPKMKIRRIDGGKDGNALTVGSRSSDAYGRIYDKFAESKLEQYQDCWRYEVEFKRSKALQVARFLAESQLPAAEAGGLSLAWFQRRRITPPAVLTGGTGLRSSREVSDDSKRLRWVTRDVRRCVAILIEHGHLSETLRALGLSASVLRSAGYVPAIPARDERSN